MTANISYCGRFAPSPTGLLHAGSLTTALGSYLEARSRGGRWLLRIEDLDEQRTLPGAADEILRVLEGLGFEWDGAVVYQRQRHALYRAALDELIRQGRVYACSCSRKEVRAMALQGVDGMIYPGHCREARLVPGRRPAWRLRVDDQPLGFVDRLQGPFQQCLQREIGDFVLLRADGCWAYQLAVVVDDAEQGVNDVVRGADLLVSTPRQIALARALGLPVPAYCHLPLLQNQAGEKLSKQTLAPMISGQNVLEELLLAMDRLGHRPERPPGSPAEFWSWALSHWRLSRVPVGPILL
jgi:glutamyl-Q tRNA(Asp) synthetase